MKSLRPIESVAIAGTLAGIAVPLVAAMVLPDTRTLGWVTFCFGAGALLGVITIAPIVAGEALPRRTKRALHRYAVRLNWYVSLLMVAAMGYLFASARRDAFDNLAMAALGVFVLGVYIKMFLEAAYPARG